MRTQNRGKGMDAGDEGDKRCRSGVERADLRWLKKVVFNRRFKKVVFWKGSSFMRYKVLNSSA